jgi:hypothetical protein
MTSFDRFNQTSSIPVRRGHPIWITSALTPADVLGNLRVRGSEWRESSVPDDLRTIGVSGLNVSLSGSEFTAQWLGQISPLWNPVCFGVVDPTDEGSRISAWFKLRPRDIVAALCLIAVPAAAVATGPSPVHLLYLCVIGAILAILLWGRGKPERLRTHLLDVLNEAALRSRSDNPAFTRSLATDGP